MDFQTKRNIFSPIIAGVMRWGVWGAAMNKSEMASAISACFDYGITTFDHADIYGDYTTEQDFGAGFPKSGISREKIQLITKCGIMHPCAQRPDYRVKHYNTSIQHIIYSAEQSLRNLKTDYLDVLLIHRPSPVMDYEAIADAFTKLSETGKVQHFGVSNFLPFQTDAMAALYPLITNQVELSLFNTTALYDGTIECCNKNGMVLSAWSPLGGKILFSDEQPSNKQTLLDIASDLGQSIVQLALNFILHHPAGIIPVIGTSRSEGFRESVGAFQKKLTDEQWFEILRIVKGTDVP
jgi:predicted oxidoreductase